MSKVKLFKDGREWRIKIDDELYNTTQFAKIKKITRTSACVRFHNYHNGKSTEDDLLHVGKKSTGVVTGCKRKDGTSSGNAEWASLGDSDRAHVLKDM